MGLVFLKRSKRQTQKSTDEPEHGPGSFVVEEEHEEQVLPGLLGHLLPQLQHVQGGHGDRDPAVEDTLPGHLRVDNLRAEDGS